MNLAIIIGNVLKDLKSLKDPKRTITEKMLTIVMYLSFIGIPSTAIVLLGTKYVRLNSTPHINYRTLELAKDACLKYAENWVKNEINKPTYNPIKNQQEYSLLKNSKGQSQVLDFFCRVQKKRPGNWNALIPWVRYLKIPTDRYDKHEIKELFFHSDKRFTYPLDK